MATTPPTSELNQLHLTFRKAYEISTNEKILDYVESIIGENIFIWATMIVSKYPNSGDYIGWHQDAKYWGLTNLDKTATIWVALTNTTTENGAMQVVPCSHKLPLYDHIEEDNPLNQLSRGQHLALQVPEQLAVPVLLQAGEGSIHHPLLIHGSGNNQSDEERIGFVIRYISPECVPQSKKHETILVRGVDKYHNFNLTKSRNLELNKESIHIHKQLCNQFLEKART